MLCQVGISPRFFPHRPAAAWVTVTGLASELAALGLGSANDLGSELNKKTAETIPDEGWLNHGKRMAQISSNNQQFTTENHLNIILRWLRVI